MFINKVSAITKKTILNFFMLTAFFGMASTGLLIQGVFHMGSNHFNVLLFGMDRQQWNTIHLVLSIFFLVCQVCHLALNLKSLKYILKTKNNKLSKKLKESKYLLLISMSVAATGLASYGFRLFGDNIERHHMMEIHDKIALLLFAIATLHIARHFKQLTGYFKTVRIINLSRIHEEKIQKYQI